jgi:hypothetical protein
MRKFFLFLCLFLGLLCLSYGSFTYEKSEMKIYLNNEGGARIVERITLRIHDDESARIYDENMAITNDITSWKARTGINEIKYNVNTNHVSISNLRVTPQPKITLSMINPYYEGVLKIEYDVKDITEVELIKARTFQHVFKREAFSFTSVDERKIILGENRHIYLYVPEDSYILSIEPKPQNIDFIGVEDKEFYWRGQTILEDFNFVFIHEISMREEVENFFNDVLENSINFVNSEGGFYLGVILGVFLVTYFMIKSKLPSKQK